MFDLGDLATVVIAFFVIATSPGPATIAVATVSMDAGRKNGLSFAIGLSVGLAFWGVIAAIGLGAILQASAYALAVLKIIGGTYLLWLAYCSANSAVRSSPLKAVTRDKLRWFKHGLLLNLLNPKAVLAWGAALAFGVGPESGFAQVGAATLLCIALGFLIYAAYALIFSTSGAMNIYIRFRRLTDGVVASLFTVAGLGLIRSAFAR